MSTSPDDNQTEVSGTAQPGQAEQAEPAQPGSQQEEEVDAAGANSSIASDAMNLLSEHKGKLAIGVAATLGLMVYYGWREKRLAKTDPEEYELMQRLRAVMRSDGSQKPKSSRRNAEGKAGDTAAASPEQQAGASELETGEDKP
jgi:hypothetical protein